MEKILRKYNRFEANNDHNEAALLLINTFGTADEKQAMLDLIERHTKEGSISSQDIALRYKLSQKYYNLLVKSLKK